VIETPRRLAAGAQLVFGPRTLNANQEMVLHLSKYELRKVPQVEKEIEVEAYQ
jgi:hypothetical protein